MNATHLLLYIDNQRSAHTQKTVRHHLLTFANWLEAQHTITEIEQVTTDHILEYVTTAHILEYKRHIAERLAPSSQARVMGTLKSFFAWAYAERLIDKDPAAQIKIPRAVSEREPTWLTVEDARRLFDSIKPGTLYAVRDTGLLWALSYGLRVSEISSLNCGDLIPPKDADLGGLRVVGKRTKQRIVPLPQTVYDALLACAGGRGDNEPLFTCVYAGTVGRMTVRGIQERFRTLCQNAGIPKEKQHCHVCRHGFAQRSLFEMNADLYTTSRLLGHGSVATTERYLRLDKKAMYRAVGNDPLVMGLSQ